MLHLPQALLSRLVFYRSTCTLSICPKNADKSKSPNCSMIVGKREWINYTHQICYLQRICTHCSLKPTHSPIEKPLNRNWPVQSRRMFFSGWEVSSNLQISHECYPDHEVCCFFLVFLNTTIRIKSFWDSFGCLNTISMWFKIDSVPISIEKQILFIQILFIISSSRTFLLFSLFFKSFWDSFACLNTISIWFM